MQRVLNAAARVVSATRKYDRRLSHLLHDQLHWLDVPPSAGAVQAVRNGPPMSALPEDCVSVSKIRRKERVS